jgi:hypothetical protein
MKLFFSLIFSVLVSFVSTAQERSKSSIENVDSTVTKTSNPADSEENQIFAQDSVPYSVSYQFKDGFYPTSEDFLNNRPIKMDKVLSTVPYTDPDYYAKVLQLGGFNAMNSDSTYTYYAVEGLYGFVQNRVFFINLGPLGFTRMTTFGRICYITHDQHTPKVQPTGGVGVNSWGGASVGVGVQINSGSTISEYIFRIEGGPVLEFTPDNLAELIKDDEITYNAYLALNKRYRMKEMYNYLHEYNRRNPLYLPANQ